MTLLVALLLGFFSAYTPVNIQGKSGNILSKFSMLYSFVVADFLN